MREVDLLDGRRQIADMEDPRSVRAHQEWRLLHRVVADRDDQIGAIDRVMHVVALGQRGGAHVETGAAGDRALAHLGVEERDLQARRTKSDKASARCGRLAAAPSIISGRSACEDHLGRSVQRRGMGDR